MSQSRPPPNRVEQRIRAEARAAVTCLMPHPDDDLRRQTALLMILGWFFWTFCIEYGLFTRGPTVLGGYTFHQLTGFLVFYTFARLQKLEVERFIPWLNAGDSGGRQYTPRDHDQDSDDDEGGAGGFVYQNDANDDDQY